MVVALNLVHCGGILRYSEQYKLSAAVDVFHSGQGSVSCMETYAVAKHVTPLNDNITCIVPTCRGYKPGRHHEAQICIHKARDFALDVLRPVLHSPSFKSGSCPLSCPSWTTRGSNTMTTIFCAPASGGANAHYSATWDFVDFWMCWRMYSLSRDRNSWTSPESASMNASPSQNYRNQTKLRSKLDKVSFNRTVKR
jgi:hypothetical protein